MELILCSILIQSGLSDASGILNPEAMLVTSVAVACLGLTVMLLKRPRAEEFRGERSPENESAAPVEEQTLAPMKQVTECEALAANQAVMNNSATTVRRAEEELPASEPMACSAEERGTGPAGELAHDHPERRATEARASEMAGSGVSTDSGPHGANALIAKVASLLPPSVVRERGAEQGSVRAARAVGSFQPAARFSRSQQAFLRIPVILTGRNEAGQEFREETCTQILLPQGAVIPMRQKVQAGERLTLTNPARQKDVACDVFGTQPGPDGKLLVEVEFPEPQKSMWPVSFPAWAGSGSRNASSNKPKREPAAPGTPALDSSGT